MRVSHMKKPLHDHTKRKTRLIIDGRLVGHSTGVTYVSVTHVMIVLGQSRWAIAWIWSGMQHFIKLLLKQGSAWVEPDWMLDPCGPKCKAARCTPSFTAILGYHVAPLVIGTINTSGVYLSRSLTLYNLKRTWLRARFPGTEKVVSPVPCQCCSTMISLQKVTLGSLVLCEDLSRL